MRHIRQFLTISCLLAAFFANAQQLPQFSHYSFNGQFISPGYSGASGQTELNVLYRYQWLGYDGTFDAGGSPKTALFTISAPIQALKSGVGLVVMKDEIGAVDIFQAQLSYAYHLNIGAGTLGVGVQGGFTNMSKGGYRANDPNDAKVPFNSSDRKFDVGAGLWYQHEKWYLGAGVTNLLGNTYEFDSAPDQQGGNAARGQGIVTAEKHLMISGGYNWQLSSSVTVTPTAILKQDLNAGVSSIEAGARATFNSKFWGELGYRFNDAATALLGVYLLKDNALSFGYAFDYTVIDAPDKSPTSHEVMLGYRLPKSKNTTKPPIRTPRYNF
ncbi:MAG: type IX secretion system membrane protein PorP/SprF [Rufibacter sp.]